MRRLAIRSLTVPAIVPLIAALSANATSTITYYEDPNQETTITKVAIVDAQGQNQTGIPNDPVRAKVLCDAIKDGDIKVVKSLLEHGEQANSVDKLGRSALFLAVDRQNLEVVQALLAAGADPNVGDIRPLMLAASYGSDPIVRVLIKSGATVNALSPHGETALFFAVHYEHLDAVRTLICAGASVGKEENGNLDLVDYTRDEEIEMQEILRSGKAYPTTQPLSPLDEALCKKIESKDYDGISLLLTREAGRRTPGAPPLVAAIKAGDSTAVRLLLEKGASANAVDEYGRSGIYLATEKNDVKIVVDLLAKGADPNSGVNMKPLMLAADRGLDKVAELLIKGGARLNPQTKKSGSTALHFAVESNHIGVVNLLIASGADFTISDKEGQTAMDYADDNRIAIRHALEAAVKSRGGIHPTTTF